MNFYKKGLSNFSYILLIISIVAIRFYFFNFDNDFWFTINQGRYVINHSFPTFALNSIHDIDFLYQSWGTGTIFYSIYHNFGYIGIIFLLTIVSLLTSYYFYKLCYALSDNKNKSLKYTFFMMVLYTLFFLNTRPHIFTTLILIIMLYLLEKYFKTKEKKYLYFLPVLSFIEVNMHGIYYMVLLIILLPYLIQTFKFKIFGIKSSGFEKKHLFIVYVLMILSGFINPYGYKMFTYGFKSYFTSSLFRDSVVELLAPNFHLFGGKIILISILIIYIIYFIHYKKIMLRHILLLLGTTYLALDAIKSYNFFFVCAIFPIPFLCESRETEVRHSKMSDIICGLLFMIFLGLVVGNLKNPDLPVTSKFIDYLDSVVIDKEKVKIYTNYNDGSYAEYRGYNCYFDPRGEIFLKIKNQDNIVKEYYDLQENLIDYRDFLDKYQFDYLLLSKTDNLYLSLSRYGNDKYHLVMEDDNYMLFQKS